MKFVRLVLYFLLILIVGGLGCWISLGQHMHEPKGTDIYPFVGNLGTFSVSVAVMAYADFLLMSVNAFSVTRALFLLVLMIVGGIAGVIGLFLKEPFIVNIAWASLLISLSEWWIIHWRNPSFDEQVTPVSSLGGSV